MVSSINGNGNVNNNVFINGGLKTQNNTGTEKIDINIADNKAFGEFGNKLLDQVQPTFIQTAKLPEEDRSEISEMFTIAGINKAKMPTAAQYASISNQVNNFVTNFDELTTTNNAENLFNSKEFKTLNSFFGIA